MSKEKQTISIDPYLQNELGKLKYENIILKAQFDNVVSQNKDLQQKIQELENKLIESKEANDTSEPKN
ncbi:hypothetical protein [Cytobacillus oceanisediminis]|uniref:hypothetical protein n=1 Tax=Cytobacillus oceanisediminis TaxID=665099 RepID=UPI001C22E71A|nr:hypothetical protein [Cytobacillus oceanisediminis]MBU8732325.1 hypothetical protein [Cytobacillus oceanisediminis]MDK7666503.1 hypothetical protein [Cytobacillus oceanisediminis]